MGSRLLAPGKPETLIKILKIHVRFVDGGANEESLHRDPPRFYCYLQQTYVRLLFAFCVVCSVAVRDTKNKQRKLMRKCIHKARSDLGSSSFLPLSN